MSRPITLSLTPTIVQLPPTNPPITPIQILGLAIIHINTSHGPCFVQAILKTKYLDRCYGRVGRRKLKERLVQGCVSNGVRFHKAKVWQVQHQEFESKVLCDDGVELKGSLVVDASGFASNFVAYDKVRHHGFQIAHGVLAEVDDHPFDLDK